MFVSDEDWIEVAAELVRLLETEFGNNSVDDAQRPPDHIPATDVVVLH